MLELIKNIYYWFNKWRYGKNYGCSRCHHSSGNHGNAYVPGKCTKCFCPNYRIG